ncbi:MAG: FKBP-type peptidyl-prolyl cis-trans isomerase, partial [Clostridia bacterium]|nr:FKBP-type peptidyl-prolyl cis-trans isomerase [Clostridia bacterium]
MKKVVLTLGAALLSVLLLMLCACGDAAQKTLIYGGTDLTEYVKLGDYKGLTVDTSSENYEASYKAVIEKDISDNGIVGKKLKGKVQTGDTANIDYEGKKNGVAFDGGTAKGYDLTIGSHSFIDGFEDGLIGVNIGDTVDLNLTFPKDYGNADLAGAAVVFTVKVNYVKDSETVDMKEHFSELGYKSYADYEASVRKRTISNILFEEVLKNSEVSDYPEKDKNILINAVYEYYDAYYKKNNNVDFETVLSQSNMTRDDFNTQMSSSVDS